MSRRADRVDLLLRMTAMPDPDNCLTWRVEGRHLTLDEVRLIQAITVQDVQDTAVLHELALEVDRSFEQTLGDG